MIHIIIWLKRRPSDSASSTRLESWGSWNVKDVPKHLFVTVTLRFKPSEAQLQIPKLEILNTKLDATILYSAKPLKHISSTEPVRYDLSRRPSSKRLFLTAHSLQHVQWVEHGSRCSSPTTASSPQKQSRRVKAFALLIIHQRRLSLFSHRIFLYCWSGNTHWTPFWHVICTELPLLLGIPRIYPRAGVVYQSNDFDFSQVSLTDSIPRSPSVHVFFSTELILYHWQNQIHEFQFLVKMLCILSWLMFIMPHITTRRKSL